MKPETFFEMIYNPENLLEKLVEWGGTPPIEQLTCIYCDGSVLLRIRKKLQTFSYNIRCTGCRKETSLFKNTFFSFTTGNICRMKLPIEKIIKFIYYYFERKTNEEISELI